MSVRLRLARLVRVVEGGVARARMRGWPDHSRLFAVGERSGWSVDEDAAQLEATARRLGREVAPTSWARAGRRQSVFLTSHFEALRPAWVESTHRLHEMIQDALRGRARVLCQAPIAATDDSMPQPEAPAFLPTCQR